MDYRYKPRIYFLARFMFMCMYISTFKVSEIFSAFHSTTHFLIILCCLILTQMSSFDRPWPKLHFHSSLFDVVDSKAANKYCMDLWVMEVVLYGLAFDLAKVERFKYFYLVLSLSKRKIQDYYILYLFICTLNWAKIE